VVPEEQIERILKEPHETCQEICVELVSAANAAGSPDNVTVMVIRRLSD
jgi:serine/threonine protein phosphatase PrpC